MLVFSKLDTKGVVMEFVGNFFSAISGLLGSIHAWSLTDAGFIISFLYGFFWCVVAISALKHRNPGRPIPEVVHEYVSRSRQIGGVKGLTHLIIHPQVFVFEHAGYCFTQALLRFLPPIGRLWVWATRGFVLSYREDRQRALDKYESAINKSNKE